SRTRAPSRRAWPRGRLCQLARAGVKPIPIGGAEGYRGDAARPSTALRRRTARCAATKKWVTASRGRGPVSCFGVGRAQAVGGDDAACSTLADRSSAPGGGTGGGP